MLIYLNGTSSSGKTSIANELQTQLEIPFFYFSIDTLLYALPKDDLEAIMGKRPHRSPLNWDSIFSGYFSSVVALIKTGNWVIADCPIYNAKMSLAFNEFISPLTNKLVVKIDCPLSVLEVREKSRKDRAIGVAKRQFEGIHNFLRYDLSIQSDKMSATESARIIIDHFHSMELK